MPMSRGVSKGTSVLWLALGVVIVTAGLRMAAAGVTGTGDVATTAAARHGAATEGAPVRKDQPRAAACLCAGQWLPAAALQRAHRAPTPDPGMPHSRFPGDGPGGFDRLPSSERADLRSYLEAAATLLRQYKDGCVAPHCP
jgi:hypothetical protein